MVSEFRVEFKDSYKPLNLFGNPAGYTLLDRSMPMTPHNAGGMIAPALVAAQVQPFGVPAAAVNHFQGSRFPSAVNTFQQPMGAVNQSFTNANTAAGADSTTYYTYNTNQQASNVQPQSELPGVPQNEPAYVWPPESSSNGAGNSRSS